MTLVLVAQAKNIKNAMGLITKKITMGLDNVYKKLNINTSNGLYIIADDNYKTVLPKRLVFLIKEKLKPVSFFCFDNKPLILFYDSPVNKEAIFKQIWNFNESPIVIINEPNSVEIYNGFSYLKTKNTLKELAKEEKLTDFSYFELVTGKSLNAYKYELKKDKRVDHFLLQNIETVRNILIVEYNVKSELANALIGKCIFARYLIDRKVTLKFEIEIKDNEDFCKLFDEKQKLISFFQYLQSQFNGDAFLLDNNELSDVPSNVFNILGDLFRGVEISNGQQSLFDIYDFSIIPVEFISNVYERFIGNEKQEQNSAYYTPKFLVDYILAETVDKHTKYECKVLDPACGSGIFLVEVLRRIIEKYQDLQSQGISSNELKQLAEDNIYGIDKDEKAINVAIFSIYLALLDYQDPKDIEKFKFPNLRANGNFYCDNFLDTSAPYNKKFQNIKLDFIIGNPPWKRGGTTDELFVRYIKNNPQFCISHKEIAQAFLSRSRDFSTQNTQCALVVTSKILYNVKAKRFRKYFLENNFINQVFELAPVAKEVFDSTDAPAVILFFKYAHQEKTDSNLIKHLCLKPNRLFSLFKIFTLRKPDIKTVVQKRLIKYDWLWKVLVYGSYLDFNFLKRLKDNYKVVNDIPSERGQGAMLHRGDANDATHLMGKKIIEATNVEQFLIKPSGKVFNKSHIHRPRSPVLFEQKSLLIKEGLDSHLAFVSAIKEDNNTIFNSSFTAIKVNNNALKTLNGLYSSKLYSYNILQTGSCAGIDRDQAHDEEKWELPYKENEDISKTVGRIIKKSKQIYDEPLTNPTLTKEKESLVEELNNEVFKSFDLSEQERDLVDYSINVSIPLIKKHQGFEDIFAPIDFKSELLENYIQIFFSRFKNSFGNAKSLSVDIWHNSYILGLFFKVTPNNNEPINWIRENKQDFLTKIFQLSTTEVTKSLFIQKDIRGFEEEGFYIIKPNEKNLWHKAMAHIDADEFMDAILKTGKKNYNE